MDDFIKFVLPTVTVIITLFLAIIKLKEYVNQRRTTLKTDLEILSLLDAEDSNRDFIKKKVDKSIMEIYASEKYFFWWQYILFITVLNVFSLWIFVQLEKGNWYYALPIAFFGLIFSVGIAQESIEKKYKVNKDYVSFFLSISWTIFFSIFSYYYYNVLIVFLICLLLALFGFIGFLGSLSKKKENDIEVSNTNNEKQELG